MGVDDSLDDAVFDAILRGQIARVFGHHIAIFGGVLAGEHGEAAGVREIDDDGSASVFEAIESGVHFAGVGFWSGAFLCILAIDFGATRFFLFFG